VHCQAVFTKNFKRTKRSPAATSWPQIVDEYLKNFPQERDVRFLCESLGLELDTTADKAFLSEPTILVRIEQDFAEGQTVSVSGWILSKTEVRVLALSSLLEQ
jgi:hypothetical protein